MNISKALKVKNRLVGEVNRLQELVKRENSRRNDNTSSVNVEETVSQLESTREKLVSLKGAINEASAPISKKLADLAETKSQINFYNSIPSREGEELTLIGSNREKLSYMWSAHLNREKLDAKVVELQKKTNDLQDEIDNFNAQTQVDFAE
jgi:peptidoglycan hydrolase CwlO-like protein